MIHNNRANGKGGGVCIYVRNDINFSVVDSLKINEENNFESIFIEVNDTKTPLYVGEIYRSPSANETKSIELYEKCLSILCDFKGNSVIGTDQNFVFLKLNN